MEKRDWWLLLWTILGCIAICWLVNSIYTNQNPVSFWVSLISACITAIGFFFTIRFQIRIESTSQAIQRNSNTIYQNIHQELNNYHLGKAISLASNIEHQVVNKDLKAALILISQLQEELAECSKIFAVNLIKQLKDCANCGDFDKKPLREILNECRERSQEEKSEFMQQMSERLVNHYVNINGHISSKGHIFVSDSLLRDLGNLRLQLNSAKSPLTSNFI